MAVGGEDTGRSEEKKGEQQRARCKAAVQLIRPQYGRQRIVGAPLELPPGDRGVPAIGVPGQGEHLDRVAGDVAGHPQRLLLEHAVGHRLLQRHGVDQDARLDIDRLVQHPRRLGRVDQAVYA